MKLKPSKNAAETARAILPAMAEKYFEAGREAAHGDRSSKQLHRFRIATKRFRYSLELFRPIYGPSLERQLEALRKLQNVLGNLSDYDTMRSLFDNDKPLDARIERAMKKKLNEFHQEWSVFASSGQLRKWKSYLARGGRPRT